MRINKFISSCGVCSRRKAEEFVKNGLVKVNDAVVTDLATDINVENDKVLINDVEITLKQENVYYMLNKPKGYVTTMSDDRDRKSILDLITDLDKRVFPVGRLDYETEGLLFLTNDGDLTYVLSHPKFEIPKTYVVKVEGEVKESEMAVLRAGVVVDGERYGKCKVELMSFKDNIAKLEVTIFEGKNREIRRMFEAIHREVIFLKRVAMAGIKLGGLMRGEKRPLKEDEISHLKALVREADKLAN